MKLSKFNRKLTEAYERGDLREYERLILTHKISDTEAIPKTSPRMKWCYSIALLLIMLGAAVILAISLDPFLGSGIVLAVAGTTLLREL